MLIKNAEALEVLERVDTLVVDKTGTLTKGKPRLASIVAVPGQDEAARLHLAVSLEPTTQPLARVHDDRDLGGVLGISRAPGSEYRAWLAQQSEAC